MSSSTVLNTVASSAQGSPAQLAGVPATLSARDRKLGVLAAVLVVLIWSGFIISARAGARGTLTPFDLIALRFSFAALVMLPFFIKRGLGRLSLQRALFVGLVAGVGYSSLAYCGFAFAPVGHASVMMPGTLPFSTALVAYLVLKEKINRERAIGLTLILVGIVMVAINSMSNLGAGTWRGDVLFVSASAVWAVYTVNARRWQIDPIDATVAVAILGAVVYLPIYAAFLPKQLSITPWSELIMQGLLQGVLSVGVAMIAFTHVVKVFGPTRTTMVTALVPGLSALGAVPILGESLSPWVLAGVVLTMLGMVVGVSLKLSKKL
jgi:drug/metabolite transporter (DMT)-like permease